MSKPSSSAVVPRHSTRLALAVAAALVGLALTGTHALAQRAAFYTCATSGDFCTDLGQAMAVTLCWSAAAAAFACWISLRKRSLRHVTLIVQACVLLAAIAAASAGLWVVSAPSITGADTQPIQF